jgi:hypothetical protein
MENILISLINTIAIIITLLLLLLLLLQYYCVLVLLFPVFLFTFKPAYYSDCPIRKFGGVWGSR